jgi:hypothetical protein
LSLNFFESSRRFVMSDNATRSLMIFFTALAVFLTPALAMADINLYERSGASLDFGLNLGAGVFSADSTGFGGNPNEENTGWSEYYVMPVLKGAYDTGHAGIFYGEMAYVGARTLGDGDVANFTDGDSKGWESERAYVGWRSGSLFQSLGEDAIDISVGEQDFSIGDGFLIMDGQFDFEDGAYWLAPHSSFDQAAVVNINTQPVRGDLFYLKSDADQGDTELYGVNIEHVNETLGTVGASYFRITDSDTTSTATGWMSTACADRGLLLPTWAPETCSWRASMSTRAAVTIWMSMLTAGTARQVIPSPFAPGTRP